VGRAAVLEQPAHQRRQPVQLAPQRIDVAAVAVALRREARLEGVEGGADVEQRVAHLVRDAGDEGPHRCHALAPSHRLREPRLLGVGAPARADVAEAPHAPDRLALEPLRQRVALERAPVLELEDVAALARGVRLQLAHARLEPLGVHQLIHHVAQQRPGVALLRQLGGDPPDLEEAVVARGHLAGAVDHQQPVGGGLERGAQQRHALLELVRTRLHLGAQRAVPGARGGEAQRQRADHEQRGPDVVAPRPARRDRSGEVSLHEARVLAAVAQALERGRKPSERRAPALARGQLVGQRLDRQLAQRVQARLRGRDPQQQLVARHRRHLALAQQRHLLHRSGDRAQQRALDLRQPGQEVVHVQPLRDRDGLAAELVERLRRVGAVRGEEHDLAQRPGLGQEVVVESALVGVGHADEVDFLGVELAQHGRPVAEAELDLEPRRLPERAQQVDVEAARPALGVERLVGARALVAAVHESRAPGRLGEAGRGQQRRGAAGPSEGSGPWHA
jgi:hypothetical protein